METIKILDFENNGVRIAADGKFLYLGSKGTISKYRLSDMSLTAHIAIKDNTKKKTVYSMLWFSIFDEYIFAWDFCDLYVVLKEDLQLLYTVRLGKNSSSDVCGVLDFDKANACVNIRNGIIDVFDINTRQTTRFEISNSTIWAHCIVGDRIYCGTAKGELLEIERLTMRVIRKIQLTKNMAIYSVAFYNDMLYTTSEKSIKVVDANTFEIVPIDLQNDDLRTIGVYAGELQTTEANIIGICGENFVVTEHRRIALFDTETLLLQERFKFPTGYRFLRYAVLDGEKLYGSDEHGIYCRYLGG